MSRSMSQSMSRNYAPFPMFFSLKGKKIYVIGGGQIAERRIGSLSDFGADITVISPEIMDAIKQYKVSWIKDVFQKEYIANAYMVLACTGNEALNHEIAQFCKVENILVNNASCKEDCDFFFPALVRHDGLVFGVSSDGSNHKKVRSVCAKIRDFLQQDHSETTS